MTEAIEATGEKDADDMHDDTKSKGPRNGQKERETTSEEEHCIETTKPHKDDGHDNQTTPTDGTKAPSKKEKGRTFT